MRSKEEIVNKWVSLMEQADRLYEYYDDVDCVKLSKEYKLQADILRWVLDSYK